MPRLPLIILLLAPTALGQSKGLRVLQPEVSITVDGDYRVIRSNGLPNHETGQFPGRRNPNSISAQQYEFRVPVNPKVADRVTPLRMQPFGVAVNGVVFDPFAAEWWNNDRQWQYEATGNGPNYLGIDASHAHVQPTGAYHYHGVPTGLIKSLGGNQPKMVLVGWAADGFPIYNDLGHVAANDPASPLKKLKPSFRIKQGQRPGGPGGNYDGKFVADYEYVAGLGDLDECNGRTGVTPEYPTGTYHYVLTDAFPCVPRAYRGTPDRSFATHGGPGGGGGQGAVGGGPGGGSTGPGGRPLPAIVRVLDTNGDGAIDADEMAQAAEVLKKLDRNGDGKLTADEYLGARPGGGRGPGGSGGPGGPGGGRNGDGRPGGGRPPE